MIIKGIIDLFARALAGAAQSTADDALAIAEAAATSGDVAAAVAAHANRTDNPHAVTYTQVGADPAGSASGAVAAHNVSATAHLGERWEGGAPASTGFVALTNTNGEAGTWAEDTAAILGAGAVFWPGTGAGNCRYFGVPVSGVSSFRLTVTAGAVIAGGAWVAEYWTGAAWSARGVLETTQAAPYTSRANDALRNAGAVTLRLGDGLGAVAKTLQGNNLIWIRFRITTPITTAPTVAGVTYITDGTLIHADGVREYFGAARPLEPEGLRRAAWTINAGTAPGSVNVTVSANITDGANNNQFSDGGINALVGWVRINDHQDTSAPLGVRILWYPNTAAVAPNNIVQWRVRHVTVIEDATAMDATAAETFQTLQATAGGTAKRVQETEIPLDLQEHPPDSYTVIKLERDARLANADDTYNNSAVVVYMYALARDWRS